MYFQNNTIIEGRICNDIELKKTQSGKSYTRFTVCFNKPKKLSKKKPPKSKIRQAAVRPASCRHPENSDGGSTGSLRHQRIADLAEVTIAPPLRGR